MINLLPPDYKKQVAFAQKNAVVIQYLRWVLITAGLVGLMMGAAYLRLGQMSRQAQKALEPKDAEIAELKKIEPEAKTLSSKLSQIIKLRSGQSHFSSLLSDLAAVTPRGVFLTSVDLGGDQSKPLNLTANADSYESAVALREALTTSPRFSGVDIISITPSGNQLAVKIVAAYQPGGAR